MFVYVVTNMTPIEEYMIVGIFADKNDAKEAAKESFGFGPGDVETWEVEPSSRG